MFACNNAPTTLLLIILAGIVWMSVLINLKVTEILNLIYALTSVLEVSFQIILQISAYPDALTF